MPLPKDMGKCMSKVKDEFPKGRSDKKKSKKAAHKQHIAMCMNVKEGLTFKEYLLMEQEQKMHVRDAIKQLTGEGKDVTVQSIAEVMDVDVSIVKRSAHSLSVIFPEFKKD